jgi:hypothetical protein
MEGIQFSKGDETVISQEIAKHLKVRNGKLYFGKKQILLDIRVIQGKKGLKGEPPEHRWDGTLLQFKNPDGTWGKKVNLVGRPGRTPKKGIDYKDGEDGEPGDDGYTPKKGIDYKDGKDGYTPVKGKDYFDGDPGRTPVKGKDYFDGEPGKTPAHQWDGTKLRFQNPDGSWGKYVNLKGGKGDPGQKPRLGKDYTVKDGIDGKDAILPKAEDIVVVKHVELVTMKSGEVAIKEYMQPIKVIKL